MVLSRRVRAVKFSGLARAAGFDPLRAAWRGATERQGKRPVVQFRELDDRVPFARQLGESEGPIVFFNTFHVAAEEVDTFMNASRVDGEFMQRQEPRQLPAELGRRAAHLHQARRRGDLR